MFRHAQSRSGLNGVADDDCCRSLALLTIAFPGHKMVQVGSTVQHTNQHDRGGIPPPRAVSMR